MSKISINYNKFKDLASALFLFAGTFFVSQPVYSMDLELRNPSFELTEPGVTTELLGWNSIGLINQAVTFNSSSPPTDGEFTVDLIANSRAVSRPALENFLELPRGELNTLGQGIVNRGSAISQLVTLDRNNILTFDFNFGIFNERNTEDFAFFSISRLSSEGFFFASRIRVLADTNSDLMVPPGDRFPETGFQTSSFIVDAPGNYLIGFGVVNANDNPIQSAVLIDNIRIQSRKTAFPEPYSGLSILALGTLMMIRTLKSKKT